MKKVIWSALFLGIVVAFGAFFGMVWYVRQLFSPVDPIDTSEIHYQVAKGATLTEVADELQEAGIARSSEGLRLYARMFGEGSNIQAGDHILHRSDDAQMLLESLSQPPAQVTITILPGWRREEIASYLAGLELSEFDADEFLDLTADLEGQLLPETYKIAPLSTTQTIVNVLHSQFESDIVNDPEIQELLAHSDHSWDEVLTVASLLQREARSPEQMRMIAAIIYSRLADNYPLQLCATAQYATGQDPDTGKWWEPPTLADTEYDSPYNTYVYKGLPPGPISSVSRAAIQAALEPTENDYYYYLHDDAGQIHYARTVEDHNRNKQLYL